MLLIDVHLYHLYRHLLYWHLLYCHLLYRHWIIPKSTRPSLDLRSPSAGLLQVCVSTTNASFTCGVLFLISEVAKSQEKLKLHLSNIDIETPKEEGTKEETSKYDAEKREPKHAHGKYSKRRRSNVAVIIDREIFISLFLF